MTAATTILAVVTDLLFHSRLVEQGRALGRTVVVADSTDAAHEALAAAPALVILDLHADGVDWRSVVATAREGSVPVLAFGRHTDTQLLRAARDAGCTRVVPRSTLVAELSRLIEELAGGAG